LPSIVFDDSNIRTTHDISLATAYEQIGWKGKAIYYYEKFLTLWKDADPGLPDVADTRERVAALKDQ